MCRSGHAIRSRPVNQNDRIQQALADLNSRSPSQRMAAVQTLGRFQIQAAISALVQLLGDTNVGAAAADALIAIGKAAVRDNALLLHQPDASARTVGTVQANDIVNVVRFVQNRQWVYVRTESAVEGWLRAALLISPLRPASERPSADREEEGPSRSIPGSLLDDLLEEEAKEAEAVPPERPEPKPSPVTPQTVAQPIQFSNFYPKEVAPNVWLALRAYIYKQSAAPQVLEDAKQQLGDALKDYRQTTDAARGAVEEGALVTATPELPGFQFNPPSQSVLFVEDWHRFDFKMRATTAPLEQAANGRITFTVEGIIVADLPMSVFVSPTAASANPTSSNPTLPATVANETARLYQAIFCSYSHRDTQIVERVERAYKILGLDFLRDATTLKSGQDWNAALLTMIDRADIFQLFWSSNSAKSKYVQQEWERALQHAAGREGFIRPVYWEQPMPAIPDALSHIHFAYEPTLDD